MEPYAASSPTPSPRRRRVAPLPAALAALIVLFPRAALADPLTGGLLGSVFRGEPFTGPRLIDLVVLGLLIFLVLRLVLGRQKTDNRTDAAAPPAPRPVPTPASRDDGSAAPGAPRPKPDMYSNAAATWAYLQGTPGKNVPQTGAPTAAPAGGDPDAEFLAGAKLAYSRILEAIAKRDFDDLAHFIAPELLASLRQSLPRTPPPEPDILLVEAKLVDKRQENGRTVMTVDYDVLIHEQNAPHNVDRFERWSFGRDESHPGANWLLETMQRDR